MAGSIFYGFPEMEHNGRKVIAHGGATFLFHTGLYFLPEEGAGLYISYNSTEGGNDYNVFEAFMDRYFPAAAEEGEKLVPRPLPKELAKKFKGYFEFTRMNFSTPTSILRLLNSMRVSVDKDSYMILHLPGSPLRFGEISEGIFGQADEGGPLEDLQFAITSQNGRVNKIASESLLELVRVPWYQTRPFILTLLIGGGLIMLVTFIGWLVGFWKKRGQKDSLLIFKILGMIFIVLYLAALINLVVTLTRTHPLLGVQQFFTEATNPFALTSGLSRLAMLAGLALILASVYLWLSKKAGLWQRIYFSALSLSVLGGFWFMWVFNII